MKTFEFKSHPCTNIKQSKCLLELGLKKETADMVYIPYYRNYTLHSYFKPKVLDDDILHYMLTDTLFKNYIPAWSLDRLLELCSGIAYDWLFRSDNYFENMVSCIEWMISKECLNKDYLEE